MPFIVLEGLDGAGKSTQIDMLRRFLLGKGIASEYMHFPRFDAPVYGELVARFLRGEFGGVGQTDPYLVASIFAGDRVGAADTIRGWLAEGKWVVIDRYVYSNVGYQCAKMDDLAGRERLKDWILNLEYGYFGIPRPDISLFLDVPFDFTVSRLRETRCGDDRSYLNGAEDIHESSLDLQRAVREMYLHIADTDRDLRIVNCAGTTGRMGTPEENFDKILHEIECGLDMKLQ